MIQMLNIVISSKNLNCIPNNVLINRKVHKLNYFTKTCNLS